MAVMAASQVYRPPVAGEPIRLREDGHWSTDGLVGYWPMREMRGGMTQDVSRFGNHGTLVNGPMWVAGKDGGAVSFDGSDDYINTGFAPTWGANQDWTITVRFRTTVAANNPQQIIASVAETGTNDAAIILQRWQWAGHGGHAVVEYFVRDTAGVTTDFQWGTAVVNDGLWHTACLVHDATNHQVRLYVDGRLDHQRNVTFTGSVDLNGYPLYVAARNDRGTAAFFSQKSVSNVSAYDRALPQKQIEALSAAPDLPIWRPRAGVSLAALAVPTGRPRPFTQHRHGPRLVIGGST